MKRLTTEQWVANAKKVHGDVYNYSKTDYITARHKVLITCREHGDFFQRPGDHTAHNAGCAKCSDNYVPSTSEWIKRAKEVHGDKYDYSHVVYVNHQGLVKIICKDHGDFLQNTYTHITTYGCPKCGRSKRWP